MSPSLANKQEADQHSHLRRVPIYSLSSLISLYSLDLAFFVDAVRDVYEVCRMLYGNQHKLTTLENARPLSSSTPCL